MQATNDRVYYSVRDFVRLEIAKVSRRTYTQGKLRYNRMSCGFDIETTRVKDKAYMWCWQFGCNGAVIIGRRWDDYIRLIELLSRWLSLYDQYVIVWVANLGHEHSFIGSRFVWDKIFAVDAHQPLFARSGRIEYRECLTISGQGGLANLAKNYTKTQKMVGDLDYNVMRNSQTKIDPVKELPYIVNDVRILCEWNDYLLSQFVDRGQKIPLTATGIPRAAVKAAAKATGHIKEIKEITKMIYPSRGEYNHMMRYLFRGGYTHGNIYNLYLINEGVIGADFKSSYPAVMEHCYYPCSRFTKTTLETDGKYITDDKLQRLCCWMIVEIHGIRKSTMHTLESEHKLIAYEGAKFDNGRLSSADRIRVALTELDYLNYMMFYEWDDIIVIAAWSAVRGRLPRYVLDPMETFYKIKEDLKKAGLDGTPEYQNAKAALNSFYGLMVQRLNFEEWEYTPEHTWKPHPTRKTYKQMICNQILNPSWGIWITAHARHRILTIIHRIDPDMSTNYVIYSDTDSVYFIDTPETRVIIEAWNEDIRQLNKQLGLPAYMSKIGTFDWIDEENGEPVHYRMKTLGAKRYLKVYEIDGETKCEITVAGMRKGSLQRKVGTAFAQADDCFAYKPDKHSERRIWISEGELFDTFDPYLLLSQTESLKNAASYSPEPYSDIVTDPEGNTEEMHELSGVAIVPIPFKIKMDWIYLSLIYAELRGRRKRIEY